jgi:Family of unknown function (DUF6502)
MSTTPATPPTTALQGNALGAEQQALLDALDGVLQPLADLCLAKGLTIQAVEERLRVAMVQSAIQAHGHLPTTRLASRISASTGLTRREVARLQADTAQTPARASRPSSAAEVFTRWMADVSLRTPDGQPMALPRLGPVPSFERLALSVTQDVHPRSLLDELCRLGLAQWDAPTDQVRLLADAFVPRGDWPRMTAFLADNVGDHLRSATANVLGTGKEHLEQAIFADELSAESLEAFKALMTEQWQHMLQSIPTKLEQLIAADKQAGRAQDQRVRVGLYSWAEPMAGAPSAAVAPPLARPQGRRASPKSLKETKL